MLAYGTTSRRRSNVGHEVHVRHRADYLAAGLNEPTRFVDARRVLVPLNHRGFEICGATGAPVLGRLQGPAFEAMNAARGPLCNQTILPHLTGHAVEVGHDLQGALRDEDNGISPNLLLLLEAAMAEVRSAIAAATRKAAVPIPRERLIGCSEAFDTRTVLSPVAATFNKAL